NAVAANGIPSDDAPLRKPIMGVADCCARAATGHVAAPPTSVMNSRRSLEVDNQFELGRLFDWQIAWLGTFQDFVDIYRRSPEKIQPAGSVEHQSPSIDKVSEPVGGRQLLFCREFQNFDLTI